MRLLAFMAGLAVVASTCAATAQTASPLLRKAAAPLVGDAQRGEGLYAARCAACHSLDANRIGPRHRDVVGRRSASVKDFRYTAALQRLNVVWTLANLDIWLENPPAMAPGTAMGVLVMNAQERADIIDYLSRQTGKNSQLESQRE